MILQGAVTVDPDGTRRMRLLDHCVGKLACDVDGCTLPARYVIAKPAEQRWDTHGGIPFLGDHQLTLRRCEIHKETHLLQ